jgi:hypothetical protein
MKAKYRKVDLSDEEAQGMTVAEFREWVRWATEEKRKARKR